MRRVTSSPAAGVAGKRPWKESCGSASFLEKEAVSLGSSALPSVRCPQLSRCPFLWTFPQEAWVTPRHECQAGALLFCLLAEDLFAFACRNPTENTSRPARLNLRCWGASCPSEPAGWRICVVCLALELVGPWVQRDAHTPLYRPTSSTSPGPRRAGKRGDPQG